MIVLVCGSRSVTRDAIPSMREELGVLPKGTVVIHGDARGADRLAAEVAESLGLWVEAYPAAWQVYGRRAGMIRNRVMLARKPDLVLAWWDGESAGTADTLREARRRGIAVRVLPPAGYGPHHHHPGDRPDR